MAPSSKVLAFRDGPESGKWQFEGFHDSWTLRRMNHDEFSVP